jgi:hypothetical protein
MKIRWKALPVAGTWHGNVAGIKTGEVADVDAAHAKRYVAHDLAEYADGSGSAHF